MLNFRNDYSAGAHPAVMEALCRTNLELTPGYGTDSYCREAADLIRSLCGAPEAAVHFFTGGTQVNKTALAAFLRPYEAVIAPASATSASTSPGPSSRMATRCSTSRLPTGS